MSDTLNDQVLENPDTLLLKAAAVRDIMALIINRDIALGLSNPDNADTLKSNLEKWSYEHLAYVLKEMKGELREE